MCERQKNKPGGVFFAKPTTFKVMFMRDLSMGFRPNTPDVFESAPCFVQGSEADEGTRFTMSGY